MLGYKRFLDSLEWKTKWIEFESAWDIHIDEAYDIAELETILPELLTNHNNLYLDTFVDNEYYSCVNQRLPGRNFVELRQSLIARVEKLLFAIIDSQVASRPSSGLLVGRIQ